MISGGNATVYVSDMDAAIRFYTESVGLKLTNRFGRQWATVEAGPSYWTTDEVGAGLLSDCTRSRRNTPRREPGGRWDSDLRHMSRSKRQSRVSFSGRSAITGEVIRFEAGNSVAFEDHDGTPTYLHEFPPEMVPSTDVAAEEDSDEEAPGDDIRRACHRLRQQHGCSHSLLHGRSRSQLDEPLRRQTRNCRGGPESCHRVASAVVEVTRSGNQGLRHTRLDHRRAD